MKSFGHCHLFQVILGALSIQLIHAETEGQLPDLLDAELESRNLAATCLYQSDFDNGTYIITEPGNYKLCEDITFYPLVNTPEEVGAAEAFEPDFDGPFDENAFGLGFFAALCIATSDVRLNLNGYTIQQSEEHALLQRFFALIELADSPFIPGVGPAQFVGPDSTFNPASNIKILGPGTIGRSSHHGIHGNENSNVIIRGVTFVDFEVAAVSLNNVDKLVISGCDIPHNRHDVPILGMFSAAKFIRPYGKILKDSGFSMNLRGVETSAADVYDALTDSIQTVYDNVIQNGRIKRRNSAEFDLFHNPHKVVDGPCYAFLVHGKGPAVGDFGFELSTDDSTTSSDIIIRDNEIRRMKCWTNEVPATVEGGMVMNDPRGAVLQLIRSSDNAPIAINEDGTYKGNVVADMQIMVAKAIHDGLLIDTPQRQTMVNTISPTIVNWASSGTEVYEPQYRCNGDSMHHVNKGMTMIRVDDAVGFDIRRNTIARIFNLSPPAFNNCFDYHTGANVENAENEASLQQGANIRGISIAASTGKVSGQSMLVENHFYNFNSDEAVVMVGIDIQGQSDSITMKSNKVNLKSGILEDPDDQYIALRLREYSDVPDSNIIVKDNNNFFQEILSMATEVTEVDGCNALADRRSANGEVETEWKLGETPGGCPFGFRQKKVKNIFE